MASAKLGAAGTFYGIWDTSWCYGWWVTVRRTYNVHTLIRRIKISYNGTVRTPTVASVRGYFLQTAHLKPQRWGRFARNLATRPNCGVRKDCELSLPSPARYRRLLYPWVFRSANRRRVDVSDIEE